MKYSEPTQKQSKGGGGEGKIRVVRTPGGRRRRIPESGIKRILDETTKNVLVISYARVPAVPRRMIRKDKSNSSNNMRENEAGKSKSPKSSFKKETRYVKQGIRKTAQQLSNRVAFYFI